MLSSDRIIIDQFASRVRELFPEAKIWAFGSRARGDAQPDSDFDICVVLASEDLETRRKIQHVAWEVAFEHGMVFQTLVFSDAEFSTGPSAADPLVKTILREGKAA
jgi:uncharacterized protein